MTGPSDSSSAPITMRLRSLDPMAPVLRSAYSRSRVRSSTNVSATNSRKISADSAAKISVSSLVSGCRNVSLNVACEKITPNSRKTAIDSATIAGVRLRFCSGRFGGVTGDIHVRREGSSPIRIRSATPTSDCIRKGEFSRLSGPGLIIPAISLAFCCAPSIAGVCVCALRWQAWANWLGKHRSQRTHLAFGLLLVTVVLPQLHEQAMHFVVNLRQRSPRRSAHR